MSPTNIWRIVAGSAILSADLLNRLYMRLVWLTITFCGIVVVEWFVNISGHPGINFVPFFVGGFFILAMGLSPVSGLAVGAALGTGFAILNDKDMSQGAWGGIRRWVEVTMTVTMIFLVISGFLATWSFVENPSAFWPVAAGALVLSVLAAVYSHKGRVFQKLVFVYSVAIIAIALFSTIDKDYKDTAASIFKRDTSSESPPPAGQVAVTGGAPRLPHTTRVSLEPCQWETFYPTGSWFKVRQVDPSVCLGARRDGETIAICPKEKKPENVCGLSGIPVYESAPQKKTGVYELTSFDSKPIDVILIDIP